MYNILETWCCLCVVALITGKSAAQVDTVSNDDVSDDSVADLNKRGWSMLRLGRGLQMLRLGKRAPSALDSFRLGRQVPMLRMGRSSDDNGRAEMTALLESIMNAPRDQNRRQPPLPRYGRDSSNNRRDLLDITGDNAGLSLGLFPTNSNTRSYVFRPAPRGGRYKRSISSDDYYKMTQKAQESLQKRDANDAQQR